MIAPTHAAAREPEREWFVASLGVRIHVVEWGDPDAPPLLCCHGFWDHARSFATLAPLLGARFRVLAMDARGHGDSEWAGAYYLALEHSRRRRRHPRRRRAGAPRRPQHGRWPRHRRGARGARAGAPGGQHRRLRSAAADRRGGRAPAAALRRVPRRPAHRRPARRLAAVCRASSSWSSGARAQNPRLAPDWLRYFVFHAARSRRRRLALEGRSAARAGLRAVAARLDRARLRARSRSRCWRSSAPSPTPGARCPRRSSARAWPACAGSSARRSPTPATSSTWSGRRRRRG